jgi:hypothetical protein
MHKRNSQKLQERKIRGIILHGSFYDRTISEVVSKMTREDVMAQIKEPTEVHLIPDIEKGEVLIDTRGKGSLQRSDSNFFSFLSEDFSGKN